LNDIRRPESNSLWMMTLGTGKAAAGNKRGKEALENSRKETRKRSTGKQQEKST